MTNRTLSYFIVIILFGHLTTACQNSKMASKESSDQYHREVYDIPVFDENGMPLDHPFLGGFNAPRPQFLDIDADGDPDLFVQEHTDELIYFEHTDDLDSPLKWRSDKFQELDTGEWFRFVDMDQDGDFDLITEQPYSYIRYYRNEGSPSKPLFTLAADSLRDINGTPIFSDRQNIPNVTDIDCDGMLDLFIGRLEGTLTRYESVGKDADGIPRFKLVAERFQNIEIVKQFGTLHGANTMAFMDIDSDGDQDIFWGDFFEPSILFLENVGDCTNPVFQGTPRPFPPSDPAKTSGYNAPSLADWGQDGDVDLFLGVLGGAYNANLSLSENFMFYEQENGAFKLRSKQFLTMIDLGDETIPAAGDLDGDGDFDLLIANKIDPTDQSTSKIYRYENRGSVTEPSFHLSGQLDLPTAYHYAPELGDLNGDGLDDLLLGSWKGRVRYYQNTGSSFELMNESIAALNRGSNAIPELGDLDGDGDLDLLVGQSGGGIQYFQNTGTVKQPIFTAETSFFEGVEVKHRSAPALFDLDEDGDLDLFLGSKIEGILFYRNIGSATTPNFVKETLPYTFGPVQLGSPEFKDLNGDGKAEYLSGSRSGGILLYQQQ